MPELGRERQGARIETAAALVLVVLVALLSAACGGGTPRRGHTVTFSGGGTFPPATIVGSYSVRGCLADAHTLVGDERLFYAHSSGAPGPADLYYFDMRLAYAHFVADGCTSKELGQAMSRGLTARQRAFLLHNVSSDLQRVFRTALDAT
jgi:hypothetical protein